MSHPNSRPKPATIARVVHDPRRRSVGRGPNVAGKHEFEPGDAVRSLTRVTNDGIYPHRDIGEPLVCGGDIGVVAAVVVMFAALAIGLCFDPRGDSWLAVWTPLSSLAATYARSYDQVVLLPALVIATGVIARRSKHIATLFGAGTLALFALGSILLYAVAASRNREDTSVALTILIFALIAASQWKWRRETGPGQVAGEAGQHGVGERSLRAT